MKRMVFAAVLLAGLACAASPSFAQAAPTYTNDDVAVFDQVQLQPACASVDVSTIEFRAVAQFEVSHAVEVVDSVELPAMWEADLRSCVGACSKRPLRDSAGCTEAST